MQEEEKKKDKKKVFEKEVTSPERKKESSPTKAKEGEKDEAKGGDLMVAEEIDKGSFTIQDFKNMFKFSVGNWGFFLYLFFAFSTAFCQLVTTYWVSRWSDTDFEE